jgi:hypothetical protein
MATDLTGKPEVLTIRTPEDIRDMLEVARIEERTRYGEWLLEEVPYKESHQTTNIPRFMCLGGESIEHYMATGEMTLFPKRGERPKE